MSETISYKRTGSGPPLLLIHGLGGTKHVWLPLEPFLAASREMIAVDLPGFGDSPVLPAKRAPTAGNLAAALGEFCERQGIERPHVAGNSLGGWVALEMARRGGARSLGLISPAGLWRQPLGPRAVNTRRLARILRPALKLALRSNRVRARMISSTVGRPEALSFEDALALLSGWIDAPGYDSANREMRRAVFERPEEIAVPTTVIWGDLDRLVRMPSADRLPPGSRRVVLPGAGHTPTWDSPEEVSALLLEASEPRSVVAA